MVESGNSGYGWKAGFAMQGLVGEEKEGKSQKQTTNGVVNNY